MNNNEWKVYPPARELSWRTETKKLETAEPQKTDELSWRTEYAKLADLEDEGRRRAKRV